MSGSKKEAENVYTIERKYLNKFTVEEMIRNLIKQYIAASRSN